MSSQQVLYYCYFLDGFKQALFLPFNIWENWGLESIRNYKSLCSTCCQRSANAEPISISVHMNSFCAFTLNTRHLCLCHLDLRWKSWEPLGFDDLPWSSHGQSLTTNWGLFWTTWNTTLEETIPDIIWLSSTGYSILACFSFFFFLSLSLVSFPYSSVFPWNIFLIIHFHLNPCFSIWLLGNSN